MKYIVYSKVMPDETLYLCFFFLCWGVLLLLRYPGAIDFKQTYPCLLFTYKPRKLKDFTRSSGNAYYEQCPISRGLSRSGLCGIFFAEFILIGLPY